MRQCIVIMPWSKYAWSPPCHKNFSSNTFLTSYFYFYWSQCESAPAIQIHRESWQHICRLISSSSILMPTRQSHNHFGNITDIKATGERRGRHFTLFAGKSRETVTRANGLALQVHFTIGARDNTLNRYGKPRFPVEDIEVQGRTVTALGLTRTGAQSSHPQGRSGHIEASWWGKIFLGLGYVYSSTTAVGVGC